jgi:hypothetical protein
VNNVRAVASAVISETAVIVVFSAIARSADLDLRRRGRQRPLPDLDRHADTLPGKTRPAAPEKRPDPDL